MVDVLLNNKASSAKIIYIVWKICAEFLEWIITVG